MAGKFGIPGEGIFNVGKFGILGIFGVGKFIEGIAGKAGIAGKPIGLSNLGSRGILTGVFALMFSNFSLKSGISGQTNQETIHFQMAISFDRML